MKGAKYLGKKGWGYDVTTKDTSVRPQDDFYSYANGGWITKAKIPPEESRWGSFQILRSYSEFQLKELMDELLKVRKLTKGSPEQMVRDFYVSAFDMKRRNKLGSKPIDELRQRVASITNEKSLFECIAYLHRMGVSCVWGTFVDQDAKESTKYVIHLWQSGLGMPDRDYYLLDLPEQVRVRDAYKQHIKKMLTLAGYSKNDAAVAEATIMRIETALARASMKKEDLRDPDLVYHKINLNTFWKTYCKQIGAGDIQRAIMGQPKFFEQALAMLSSIPLSDWKVYLDFHVINDEAGVLSDPFIKQSFEFYSKTLRGVKKMKPLWRRSLMSASSALSDQFGKLYVDRYFPASAKKKMDLLVSDLFDIYANRIKNLDWMSEGTKKKALKKLRSMNRKIAYPKKWDFYKGVEVTKTDYYGNVLRIHEYEHKKMMRKLKRGIDREEWFMSPQTVNAYFAPNLNDIVFPAAILQWPFFDPEVDDAVNYAGIGSVIGHEMTHGFDDSGSKYDSNGNLFDWWTPADRSKFDKKGKLIVNQANAHKVTPEITLNGQLTLGENIADLGGLVIAFDAFQKHLSRVGRKVIDGLTPEQRFFLSFAQTEREIARVETLKVQALTDPHAAAQFRINAPLSNFDPFYEAFDVKKGDKLFLDPNRRARIW